MNYEQELQRLKSWDEVQYTTRVKGYDFITTAGHGYLVVPKGNAYYWLASKIVSYGFKGRQAIYLEEDCEASEFLNKVYETVKEL